LGEVVSGNVVRAWVTGMPARRRRAYAHLYGSWEGESQTTFLKILDNGVRSWLRTWGKRRSVGLVECTDGFGYTKLLVDERGRRLRACKISTVSFHATRPLLACSSLTYDKVLGKRKPHTY
jgi:hypothetical protein